MKKYKILTPISHSGRIYKVDEVIGLSTDSDSYFNFWHRRIQDKEIEEIEQCDDVATQFETNKASKNTKEKVNLS